MRLKNEENPSTQPEGSQKRGADSITVGHPGNQGSSRGQGGLRHEEGQTHPRGSAPGQPLSGTKAPGDNLRKRHSEGVRPEDVDLVETEIRSAFEKGNPSEVWRLVQGLLKDFRELAIENARIRFRVNFGTDICERCEGLHAGEGVSATCFQAKLCYYDNVKKKPTPRQLGIIEGLEVLRDSKKM